MAKYDWQDDVLVIDFEVEGLEVVKVDMDAMSDEVRNAAMKFGMQTALRNSTAGKMDDPKEGYAAMVAKLGVFRSGTWEKKGEGKAKVELSEAEKLAAIGEVLVAARRAKGDTRSQPEIIAAFEALEDERKVEVLKALAKPIEKAQKQKLDAKRKLGKTSTPDF